MFVRKLTANYVPRLTRVLAALGILATLLIVLGLAVDSGVFRCAMAFAGQKAEMTNADDDVARARATAERTSRITEYGVTLALQGDVERAESVFMSLLSTSPKDPRALNNLGNLHLIKGEPAIALAFYDRAMVFDTTDAGIRLNRSLAMMLSGDNAEARAEAQRAIRMAGGVDLAAALLALKTKRAPSKEAKVSTQAYLSKSEVMALLESAVSRVPDDTSRVAQSDSTRAVSKEAAAAAAKAKAWRSAGLRASDVNEVTTSVYWKK